jgi:hypothetical protein
MPARALASMRELGALYMASFEFQSCRLATRDGSEEGVFCMGDGVLFAILAPAGAADEEPGWYLHLGFGPCAREGLIFRNLNEAGEWLEQAIAEG